MRLREAGLSVVLADVDTVGLGNVIRTFTGGSVAGVPTDVRDPDAVSHLAAVAIDTFGRVDVIVNNAGVWTLGYQWEMSTEDWCWVLDVNLWGVIHGVRTFVPLLLANADGGHVVNVASMDGITGSPFHGPYAASKHAVVGLSKGLRAELSSLGANVGVSVVCPGRVPELDPGEREPASRCRSPRGAALPLNRRLLSTPCGAMSPAVWSVRGSWTADNVTLSWQDSFGYFRTGRLMSRRYIGRRAS